VSGAEDTNISGNVLANDTDADNNILTATKLTDPANGTVSFNSDGSFTYTPNANFNGSDNFTYKANDGQADSNVATVHITVTQVTDNPDAIDDSATVNEGQSVNIAVLGNDTDIDN